jgi:DNA-binding LacI/PurR family transcriptional regulator
VLLARLGVVDCRVGVRAMLDEPDLPRGFVLASSLIVFKALGALVQAGRTVGRDVSVAPIAREERPWTALLPADLLQIAVRDHEIGRRA